MKERYDLNKSIESWKIYFFIKANPNTTYKEIGKAFNKDRSNICLQLKPLRQANLIKIKGGGKKEPFLISAKNNKKYVCPCCQKVI